MPTHEKHQPNESLRHDYDAFLAFAGPDREKARLLYNELGEMGLRVFMDEHDIQYFQSITGTIEQALGASKSLVAYYSKNFSSRPACQLELSMVYTAKHPYDPCDRIIVLNPEADTGHIMPSELANADSVIRVAMPVSAIARAIGGRIACLDGTIGGVSAPRHPVWHGRYLDSRYSVWRYPELWGIHSALSATSPNADPPDGSVASVTGPSGIGKSKLVEMYARMFSPAYKSTYWPRLESRNHPKGEMVSYDIESLQLFARQEGIDVTPDHTYQQLLGTLAAHLDRQEKPSLWVIDGILPEIDYDALRQLMLPTRKAKTILVSDEDIFDSRFPTVEVGPLSSEDARELVGHYREPVDKVESAALDRLINRLGGNARALYNAALQLQDMQGIVSYDDYSGE